MIQPRLTIALLPVVSALTLLVIINSGVAIADQFKLCPRGNVSLVGGASRSSLLFNPDRCYPVPVINRNELHSKPIVRLFSAQPGMPFKYTVLMVEANRTYDTFTVYWLDTNLTVDNSHALMQNLSLYRDVRKMIEYRPPKASPYNVTYLILVYRQSPNTPVESPPRPGTFKPQAWAANSHLTLIGGAEFIVRGNLPNSSNIPPAHHLPLPPAVIPLPPSGGYHPSARPPLPPSSGINALTHNNTYHYNATNSTGPHHYYPGPPPPYNPGYVPQPPPPYNPGYVPQPPPPYNPGYVPQPPPTKPNKFYPPTHKKHKGGAAELRAATSLITFVTLIAFILNL